MIDRHRGDVARHRGVRVEVLHAPYKLRRSAASESSGNMMEPREVSPQDGGRHSLGLAAPVCDERGGHGCNKSEGAYTSRRCRIPKMGPT